MMVETLDLGILVENFGGKWEEKREEERNGRENTRERELVI